MPRNVRNFWIELSVDGRKSRIETGPSRKDGGFSMTVRVRENGGISKRTLEVFGNVIDDDTLYLEAAERIPGQGETQGFRMLSSR
jgi:hypothetical protein